MLKTRIIPTLLWRDEALVKGKGFDSWRRVGSILPAIKVYCTRQVDELMLLDITATPQNREPDFDTVADVSRECFVPLTLGGGIRSLAHIREMLRAGADKVSLNTAFFENPDLVTESAQSFGSQCIVVSIDAKKEADGTHCCYTHCGTTPTAETVESAAKRAEQLGAGEILITSIDRDGTMQGYDLELIAKVASAVRIPVIAGGGAGKPEDLLAAVAKGQASAVAAASLFHFTHYTPLEMKQFLAQNGVPTRITATAR
jgi:cyclase